MCRLLHVACCLLHVVCRKSCLAYCHLARTLYKQSCMHPHTSKRSRFTGMAGPMIGNMRRLGARAVGLRLLPYVAAAPLPSLQSSVGLQLAQIAAAGTATEKSLLSDVTAKNPDASCIELLRLFKARRREWALAALCCVCVIASAARKTARICSQLPHLTAQPTLTEPRRAAVDGAAFAARARRHAAITHWRFARSTPGVFNAYSTGTQPALNRYFDGT